MDGVQYVQQIKAPVRTHLSWVVRVFRNALRHLRKTLVLQSTSRGVGRGVETNKHAY